MLVSPLGCAHPQAKEEGFHQEAERWGNVLLSGNLLETFRELSLEAQGTHAFLRSGPSRFREFWIFFFFFLVPWTLLPFQNSAFKMYIKMHIIEHSGLQRTAIMSKHSSMHGPPCPSPGEGALAFRKGWQDSWLMRKYNVSRGW